VSHVAKLKSVSQPTSLRERKKQQSRRSIHDAAVRLFLERGFEQVTVADVAAAADIAVTTLFRYFPEGKDALVFAWEESRSDALAKAIYERSNGTDVLQAIEDFIRSRGPFGPHPEEQLQRLIATTPALRDRARRKWTDCEERLAEVLSDELNRPADANLRALARYILEAPDVAAQDARPAGAIAAIFERLRTGWQLPHGRPER